MTDLQTIIAAELAEPVDPRVVAMAAAVAAQHGQASLAVLFYGSCLRECQLDGLMLDFYLIVSDYGAAYSKRWMAAANRLIPPNVFPFAHAGLAAKYAVLSSADFEALNRPEASTVSVWARFCQPVRLVWVKGEGIAEGVSALIIDGVGQASATLTQLARPMADGADADSVWRAGFALTYTCELRAERGSRSGSIVDSDPLRYARIAAALPSISAMSRDEAQKRWAKLRRHGKLMSVVRLAKASLTFAGGIDYIAWKINRHAGTAIQIKPWQRRWPLLGAITLVPKLFASGAIK